MLTSLRFPLSPLFELQKIPRWLALRANFARGFAPWQSHSAAVDPQFLLWRHRHVQTQGTESGRRQKFRITEENYLAKK